MSPKKCCTVNETLHIHKFILSLFLVKRKTYYELTYVQGCIRLYINVIPGNPTVQTKEQSLKCLKTNY